jgi:hypothetical protein
MFNFCHNCWKYFFQFEMFWPCHNSSHFSIIIGLEQLTWNTSLFIVYCNISIERNIIKQQLKLIVSPMHLLEMYQHLYCPILLSNYSTTTCVWQFISSYLHIAYLNSTSLSIDHYLTTHQHQPDLKYTIVYNIFNGLHFKQNRKSTKPS